MAERLISIAIDSEKINQLKERAKEIGEAVKEGRVTPAEAGMIIDTIVETSHIEIGVVQGRIEGQEWPRDITMKESLDSQLWHDMTEIAQEQTGKTDAKSKVDFMSGAAKGYLRQLEFRSAQLWISGARGPKRSESQEESLEEPQADESRPEIS